MKDKGKYYTSDQLHKGLWTQKTIERTAIWEGSTMDYKQHYHLSGYDLYWAVHSLQDCKLFKLPTDCKVLPAAAYNNYLTFINWMYEVPCAMTLLKGRNIKWRWISSSQRTPEQNRLISNFKQIIQTTARHNKLLVCEKWGSKRCTS